MQKIKMDCDACGAPLQLVDRTDFLTCPFCGRSYIIEDGLRNGGEQQRKRSLKAKTERLPVIPVDWRTSLTREELVEKIKGLLADRSKIQAIKLYRDQTGAGLKEAKDFVESLEGKKR